MAIRRGFASKIDDVEYFYAAETDAARASALGMGIGESDANGERRDYVRYLSQTDNDADKGRFVVLERGTPDQPRHPPDFRSPLASIETGQTALGSICRDLIAGKYPANGKVALSGRMYQGKRHNPGGFDCQIGTPKGVSLAAAFNPKRSAEIRAAERKGYDDAMRWAFDQGFFATRVTHAGQTSYEPAQKIVMAVYKHATSRAEDPHDHHHGAVFAMCERQDGSLGTLSNYLLLKYGGAIQAFKKCSEAGALRRIGLAVELNPDNPRDYRLAGVDGKLVDLFSKRRAMVEAAASRAGIDTATERLATQLIAYDTREDKRFRAAAELEARWDAELKQAGWTREAFVFALDKAARDQAAQIPDELGGCAADPFERSGDKGVKRLAERKGSVPAGASLSDRA